MQEYWLDIYGGNVLINRLCIFSFYDASGHADSYIHYLLQDLLKCVNRLIIVVNGEIEHQGQNIFRSFTDEIYIRKNVGFDAGAYRYVLIEVLKENELKKYDEIILCNDTFFGPLKSFVDIFHDMEGKPCDFWGINGYFDMVFSHIQSYFMVFRKNIIVKKLLTEYFRNSIDGSTMVINDVYCRFESGLFDFLARQSGMKYAIYVRECNYDVYKDSYAYLKDYQLPIVKKRAFSKKEENFNNIWCTLSYVKYETEYDVKFILNCIQRIYGLRIKKEEIQTIDHYIKPDVVNVPIPLISNEQIERFSLENNFYIYGIGMYACKAYWRFAKDNQNFKGFIISDKMSVQRTTLYGYPVFRFSEIENIYSQKILLSVVKKHAIEILQNFEDTSNVLRIF